MAFAYKRRWENRWKPKHCTTDGIYGFEICLEYPMVTNSGRVLRFNTHLAGKVVLTFPLTFCVIGCAWIIQCHSNGNAIRSARVSKENLVIISSIHKMSFIAVTVYWSKGANLFKLSYGLTNKDRVSISQFYFGIFSRQLYFLYRIPSTCFFFREIGVN